MENAKRLANSVFNVSQEVRYVAIYNGTKLYTQSREDLKDSSSSESDKYEEIIVNPTLLKLVTQRGDIDCGGLKYVLLRYGNFYQFIYPLKNGHISVALELSSSPNEIAIRLADMLSTVEV